MQPQPNTINIYDAPPGASCSVVETLRGVDFALLVTEPTPFGLHDLKQMLGILSDMNIPSGVVINRDGIGDNSLEETLRKSNIPVLLRVPFDRALAENLAAGRTLIEVYPDYQDILRKVYQRITEIIGGKIK
ncbi:MAG TPA: (4Fe-4S)-binding protein, partial [Anaerolineaceae bacterium]|nr:(4Fe-4S)-binding protein [Anaerolineaceae bacterium]